MRLPGIVTSKNAQLKQPRDRKETVADSLGKLINEYRVELRAYQE